MNLSSTTNAPPIKPPAPAAAPTGPSIVLETIQSAGAAQIVSDAWQTLASEALEPNAFYEPWMLLPAWRTMPEPNVSLHLFWRTSGRPNESRQLIGVFPVERRRSYRKLPISTLRLRKHALCSLCTPLLHRDHAHEALTAFLDSAAKEAGIVEMDHVHGDGPFARTLIDVLRERNALTLPIDAWNRALIVPGTNADDYVANAVSSGTRKELKRHRKRLGEWGRFEARTLATDESVEPWIEHFLALEAAGWKGETQTALGCTEGQREFFATVARSAHARGQLRMLGFFLDDRPIALKCNFLSAGRGSFAFKIAYDERYAKHSPGMLLEIDNIGLVHSEPALGWMDSCAVPKHPMIDRLWTDRRTIQHLAIAVGGIGANLGLGLLYMARALKRAWKSSSAPSPSGRGLG
ncbi:MAG: GNAT family N-acetyltransferase [Gemmataceae bacterium]|nr:GNAT family N-acetyltransferase [Gemmataceae bacterium]